MQQSFKVPDQRMSRDERRIQVAEILHQCGPMTIAVIARRVGLRKSPYLRDLLNDIIAAGLATCEVVQTTRPIPTYRYIPVRPDGV